ncbi:radical SAM family heme chaperone HemW [Lentiprolixibacter aurantiacus]|uniref:Heme chaperone HemW n=1 Tax=Lentiprolixibacter aurantiacus TaxID=2993939 RepID=A0AAE3SNY8_9FLAO|nr:radical SAM family heme chaperone HemW [Lentiprolixibacter aurantiacus]MCX2718967.1 radical SAM family heme chaperone HemW [Lentiprolixibacter aurantiacus]
MSGIYIHIPFCKQACHYCDFHYSTQLKKKKPLLNALQRELEMRKGELPEQLVETLYFGGGTPSLMEAEEIAELISRAKSIYTFPEDPEITLEVNPDDVSQDKARLWRQIGINRLSMGIQSFFEEDLKFMNRAHNATEAREALEWAGEYFDNISLDLIYGYPLLTEEKWMKNLETALSYEIPHISAYALTVEPRTALQSFIEKGKVPPLDEAQAEAHFRILVNTLENEGYVHYEISNFGKPDYFSQNNTAYWIGKPYLGIGPSAHSFYGRRRGWNISNNSKYIKSIEEGKAPVEYEELSDQDRYNEYIMTGLRTIWGVSPDEIEKRFGASYRQYFLNRVAAHLNSGDLILKGDAIVASPSGKFLIDGLASDLFRVG